MASSYFVNAALQLKSLPTPGVGSKAWVESTYFHIKKEGCDKDHESDDEKSKIAATSLAKMRECLQRFAIGLDQIGLKEIDFFFQ